MPLARPTDDMPLISLDTETTGLDLYYGAQPFLVTMCDVEGGQLCWEWDVDPLTRRVCIPADDLAAIQHKIDRCRLVMQNGKFDVTGLDTVLPGIAAKWPWSRTDDTLIGAHLLASNQPKDLYTLGVLWLGRDESHYEDKLKEACKKARDYCRRHLKDWKIAKQGAEGMPSIKGTSKRAEDKPWKADSWLPRTLWRLQIGPGKDHPEWESVVRDYANADSALTLAVWRVMEAELRRQGLWEIYRTRRLLPGILQRMETRGLGLYLSRLSKLRDELENESDQLKATCEAIANTYGFKLELPEGGVNQNLREFAFDVMKLPYVRNPKAKTDAPAFDQKHAIPYWLDVLPRQSKQRLFVTSLVKKRQRDTSVGYLDSYQSFGEAAPPVGRVHDCRMLHPTLNPTATGTLRFNCVNPNAQQVKKDDIEELINDRHLAHEATIAALYGDEESTNRNLRGVFGPPPGREYWCKDYENLELRIPGYEAGERKMIELFEHRTRAPYFGSYHLLNASLIFPKEFERAAKGATNASNGFKKHYPLLYRRVKNFGFAVQYGAIPESGTADRAVGVPGAHRRVLELLPALKRLNEFWKEFGERHGYVETLPDRTVDPHRGYPLILARSEWNRIEPTKPLNYHVQGTAMWCTMKAMIRLDSFFSRINSGEIFAGRRWTGGYYMALQVHDEIVFDFPALGRGNLPIVRECRRLMELSGDDIGIPLRVSVSYHPRSWAEEVPLGIAI